MTISCKHCSRTTASSPDVARMLGWRMFTGTSVTGKAIDDVVCPYCAGTKDVKDEPSWQVGCYTCDWEWWPEEGDEGPLTEKDAEMLAREHECEKDTWVKPPEPARVPVLTVAPTGGLL